MTQWLLKLQYSTLSTIVQDGHNYGCTHEFIEEIRDPLPMTGILDTNIGRVTIECVGRH